MTEPDVSQPDLGWRELTLDDREREYSPSSCVDDLGPFLDAYARESAVARQACADAGLVVSEVRYGDLATQTIDLVSPGGSDSPAPLIVFIHGGYWQELSKTESFFAAHSCAAQGVAFAAVDYTLAPTATLDQIVGECLAAVQALVDESPTHHLDPERVVVTGSSAGAHLAAMVGLGTAGWRPAAVGLVSGIFDLEPLVGTYINDALGLDPDAARINSPAHRDLRGFPTTVIAHGSNETEQFKRQSRLFASMLSSQGTAAQELEVTDRNHFDVIMDLCNHETALGHSIMQLTNPATERQG